MYIRMYTHVCIYRGVCTYIHLQFLGTLWSAVMLTTHRRQGGLVGHCGDLT